MATFTWTRPFSFYATWVAISFFATFILNSFCEWIIHSQVLHKRKSLLSYPFEKHTLLHHVIFRADETYVARDDYAKGHITFTALDYVLVLLFNFPLWAGIEFLTGRPWILGGFLATLGGLQAFNSLHLRYHCPSDTWFQRTWVFKYLREYHRLHHDDPSTGFNVYFFPIADACFGTLAKAKR